MKRFFCVIAIMAVMVATTSCEKILGIGKIEDVPKIEFEEQQMIVPAEGCEEFIIPINSTGIDHVDVSSSSNWVTDINGDLVPIDEWIEVVKVINEYDVYDEATRALPTWRSAIVVKVKPNDTPYVRTATIAATSFTVSDQIIIRQGPINEE